MIVQKIVNSLVYTFSDAGLRILQTDTGTVYDDALDIPNSGHNYEETNEPVGGELSDAEAINILLGRNGDE